ncbi:MAG: hypothetical protein HZA13_06395 [Nitrospirae bacterium]|nr:hypothetical protein [Nitrospirota bacterium]
MIYYHPIMQASLNRIIKSRSSTPVQKIANKIRRYLLCKTGNGYIEKQMAVRLGDCLQCGRCCRLIYRCPFLAGSGSNIRCLIYHKGRPDQCRAFPIDRRDLGDVDFRCGYFFLKKEEVDTYGLARGYLPSEQSER